MAMKSSGDPRRKVWTEGYNKGFEDGQTDQRVVILSFLQKKYMDMSIPTDDPRMVAILDVVTAISEEFGNRGN